MLTALATFPLIFMGGLVTSHQAGMSVPDWPNTYGYNMFLFPPRLWIGGIFYEHTHRLMGTVVGILAIMLAIWAWKDEPRRWVRNLCYLVLAAVIFQGVLGGLRVLWVNLDLAIIHACFAQAFFCLTGLVVAATSRWWCGGDVRPPIDTGSGILRRTATLAIIAAITIYAQLVVGAVMRHEQAGLAIPDLPLAYGQLIPPTDDSSLAAANRWRADLNDSTLELVTLSQIWFHFGHRIGAILVTIALAMLITHILRRHAHQPLLARPALLLIILLLTQLTLGVLVVLWRKPADLTSIHVAIGALTLFVTALLGIRAWRIAGLAMNPAPAAAPDKRQPALFSIPGTLTT